MKDQSKQDRIAAARARQFAALESLWQGDPGKRPEGVTLWRRLRRIETKAHNAATAQCNGAAYGGEPFREEAEEELFDKETTVKVGRVFGGKVPEGFFINGDPRGYALKIDPDKGTVPEGMSTDWGRYGILAADISDC